jgi:ribose transport system ATP-binding protein
VSDRAARPIVLRVEGLSKSFPGVKAFDSVEFDLEEGEIHCVVGENGAGKSTFIKLLSGVYPPDSGAIVIGQRRFTHLTPRVAQAHGIQTVFQEVELAPPLTVAENLFIGGEVTGRLGLIDYPETRRRARQLLAEFGVGIDVTAQVRHLSLVEQTIVQVVKALAKRPRILILDEATASFSQKEISQLLDLVRQISSKGVSVLYISHHIEEVFRIADRITVLRDGRKVGCFRRGELNVDALVALIVGTDARAFYRKTMHRIDHDVVLDVADVARAGVFDGISFRVRGGEVLGIAGPIGAGKTELARLLFGLDRMDRGRVTYRGRDITAREPAQAIRNGMCLLTENRRFDGLLLRRPLLENITSAGLRRFPGPLINLRTERALVQRLVQRLDVKCTNAAQAAGKLSGGNQQKVVLAKWFFIEPDIYIFDEPTVGVDVGAKQEIYSLIAALADEGKILIIISSDLPELAALCTRVIVMKNRRMAGELSGDEVTEEKVLRLIIGNGSRREGDSR